MANVGGKWPTKKSSGSAQSLEFGSPHVFRRIRLVVNVAGASIGWQGTSVVEDHMEDAAHKKGPEIVLGLVGAVGTDLELVSRFLSEALADLSYRCVPIQLSKRCV